MTDVILDDPVDKSPAGDPAIDNLGHPRGTLAIVILYGILFALGWIALYFLEFSSRGMPQ